MNDTTREMAIANAVAATKSPMRWYRYFISSEFHACAKRSRRSVSVFLELVHAHKAREEEDNEHHQEEKEEQHITRALSTPEGVLRHAVFRVYM